MILVTGASGKTGRAVVSALARIGAEARALVHHPSQVESLLRSGAVQAVPGDMREAGDLRRAFEGIHAVYHICPNVHPDEIVIGRTAIAAAREVGVDHFAFHSVLHPQTQQMPHHWNKSRVEEALIESGMDFTILQPTAYMQNLLGGWDLIRRGVLRNPYPVETRLSLVDLEDVAESAAVVLTHDGHRGATYELVGTPPLSQVQVAGILTEALGRLIVAEAEPLEAWEARALATGIGDHPRAVLLAMFRHYDRHGLKGNPNTLRWLLDREPTTLAAFATRAENAEAAESGSS